MYEYLVKVNKAGTFTFNKKKCFLRISSHFFLFIHFYVFQLPSFSFALTGISNQDERHPVPNGSVSVH